MNREDVIRMAEHAGFGMPVQVFQFRTEELERFAALVAAEKEQQMIRDGYRQCAKGQRTTQFCGLLDAAVKAEREKVVAWMRSKSYATGHGDTVEDLLKELEWQVAEREREACAKVCEGEQFELTQDVAGKNGLQHFDAGCRSCAEMIRARGEM